MSKRSECTQFIADPCGSARCAGCGKRRREHRQAGEPPAMTTEQSPLSEAPARCPFCGSEPQYVPQNSSLPAAKGGYTQFIWCENCGCQGPDRQTPQEAIAAWNRRLPLPEDGGAGGVAEPTEAMLEAGEEARKQHTDRYLDGSEVAHGDVVEHIWRAMVSASLPAPIAAAEPAGTPVVTEGMVLVPREPTEAMYEVAYPWFGSSQFNFREMYAAMIRSALAFSKGAQNG